MSFEEYQSVRVHRLRRAPEEYDDFGARFEHLAHDYCLEGCCERTYLTEISPEFLVITQASPTTAASSGLTCK